MREVYEPGLTNTPYIHSALGHKQTLAHVSFMSALPPKADIRERDRYVRFVPIADSCSAAKTIIRSAGRRWRAMIAVQSSRVLSGLEVNRWDLSDSSTVSTP
jgi:hypothetical protein